MFLINAFEPPRSFDLHTGEFVLIGRGEHCDVKLDDPSVSRVHCRVLCRDGRVLLTDAGSRWGTFVNGERIEQAELKPGDRVRVGETVLTVSAQRDSHGTTIAPLSNDSHAAAVTHSPETQPVGELNESFEPAVRETFDSDLPCETPLPAQDAAEELHRPPSSPPQPAFALDTRPFVPARFLESQFLRYRVESLISHSRSGMSFVANDPALQRKVVIKFYRPDLLNTEAAVGRFLRAVRTMINFRQANIVRLFDAGEKDGLCYTITEHIDGVTGAKLIKDFGIAGMLDWQTVLRLGIDLCNGLTELHSHGVVHRDIRPGHILITNSDRRALIGEVVLAKAWDREQLELLTAAGDVVGDLAWQSPEQIGSGEPVDHRSDLYQLGLTLYVLLTGTLPFPDGSAAQIVQSILTQPPTSPKSKQLSIPDLLADVVVHLLAKRPVDRPQSADEAKENLERVRKFATI